jgi:hypothetical protein
MACGSDNQKHDLWQTLNEHEGEIPHEIVEVLIREAVSENIEQVLVSLGKLANPQQTNRYLSALLSARDALLSILTQVYCALLFMGHA